MGQFLQSLATPFLVKELTGSNSWVGAVSFAALIPMLVVTPIAGNLADRVDRRRLLLSAYMMQIAVTVAFFVLHQSDELTPWRMFFLSIAMGVAGGLQWSPIQAMAAVLVPRTELASAVRLVSISFTVGRSIGPALAGVVLATSGPGLAYFGTMVLSIVAIFFLWSVRITWEPAKEPAPFVSQLVDGVRYVFARPPMRAVIGLAFVVALLAAAFAMPLATSVARDGFDVGGGGLGALTSMLGVGSVVASVFVATRGDSIRRSRMEMGAVLIYAVGLFVTASTGYLAVGLVGFFLMGAAHMVHGVTLTTSLQLQVEEEYRGRVMATWLMSLFAGLPLGALIGGVAADAFGIRTVLAINAGLLLVFLAVTAARTRGLAVLDVELEELSES